MLTIRRNSTVQRLIKNRLAQPKSIIMYRIDMIASRSVHPPTNRTEKKENKIHKNAKRISRFPKL